MGGRGTFAAGKQAAYTYETVGKVDGVKIINPIDKSKSLKLPEESHMNNPVSVSLLSGDRKPQIRFWGNHHSGSGNLYHKSFRM